MAWQEIVHNLAYLERFSSHAASSIVRMINKQPPRISCKELIDLQASRRRVTPEAVNNTLHQYGCRSCRAQKVPFLNKSHVESHLKFDKEHLYTNQIQIWIILFHLMRIKQNHLASIYIINVERRIKCSNQKHCSNCEAWMWQYNSRVNSKGAFFYQMVQDNFI